MPKTAVKNVASESLMSADFDDFDFEQECAEDSGVNAIPYAQIVNPELRLTRYDQEPTKDYPFGLFIPQEQADKAGFYGGHNWIQASPVLGGKVRRFGEGGDPGWMVKPGEQVRLIVVANSQTEVYKPVQFNGKVQKKCLGLYLQGFDEDNKPIKSSAGLEFDSQPPNSGYQKSDRYLFWIVDEKNNALHERPIQIRISTGFGIGFKSELRKVRQEIVNASKLHGQSVHAKKIADAVAAKNAANASGNAESILAADAALKHVRQAGARSLTQKDRHRFVFAFTQMIRENNDGVATTFISSRERPSFWTDAAPGVIVEDVKDRNGSTVYSLEQVPVAYTHNVVRSDSELGRIIAAQLDEYVSFVTPPNLRQQKNDIESVGLVMPGLPDEIVEYTYDWTEEPSPETSSGYPPLAQDPDFASVMAFLEKANTAEKLEKWKVWAKEPLRRAPFLLNYPDYDEQVDTMAASVGSAFG